MDEEAKLRSRVRDCFRFFFLSLYFSFSSSLQTVTAEAAALDVPEADIYFFAAVPLTPAQRSVAGGKRGSLELCLRLLVNCEGIEHEPLPFGLH